MMQRQTTTIPLPAILGALAGVAATGVAGAAAAAAAPLAEAGECEPVSLHRCLAARGFGRMFILPRLPLRHSDATGDAEYVLLTLLLLLPSVAPCVWYCLRLLGWRTLRPAAAVPAATNAKVGRWARWARWAPWPFAAWPGGGAGGCSRRCWQPVFVVRILGVVAVIALSQAGLLWQLHSSAVATAAAAHGETKALASRAAAPLTLARSATLLLPLVLPALTALDLVAGARRRGGFDASSIAVRAPAAALTIGTPIFWMLELSRLQGVALPLPPAGADDAADADGGSVLGGWLRQPWPSALGLCREKASPCKTSGAGHYR